MYGSEFSYWWIVPILMMILCFLMMRGRMRSICGCGSPNIEDEKSKAPDTAMDMLDKRYASGAINKEEYEEIRRTLTEPK